MMPSILHLPLFRDGHSQPGLDLGDDMGQRDGADPAQPLGQKRNLRNQHRPLGRGIDGHDQVEQTRPRSRTTRAAASA
eukprot:6792468-Pyramimonas_sp.AAC.1